MNSRREHIRLLISECRTGLMIEILIGALRYPTLREPVSVDGAGWNTVWDAKQPSCYAGPIGMYGLTA